MRRHTEQISRETLPNRNVNELGHCANNNSEIIKGESLKGDVIFTFKILVHQSSSKHYVSEKQKKIKLEIK